MPSTDLQQTFLDAASEVLETMFFTGVVDEESEETSSRIVSADLFFRGNPSGQFGVRVPYKTGQSIASSFLGFDENEVTEQQVADVVGELTNMLCGSVLSRLESGVRFELSHPEIDPANTDWKQRPGAQGHTFGLEEGTLGLWIATDNAPAMVA